MTSRTLRFGCDGNVPTGGGGGNGTTSPSPVVVDVPASNCADVESTTVLLLPPVGAVERLTCVLGISAVRFSR